jgi:hypothetical protein
MRRVAQSAAMGTRLTAMDAPATRGAGEATRGCCGVVSGWWKGVFRFYLNLSSRFELIRNRLFSSRPVAHRARGADASSGGRGAFLARVKNGDVEWKDHEGFLSTCDGDGQHAAAVAGEMAAAA